MTGFAFARPGDVVAGRFRVEAKLGQGGFGVVLCATQLALGRQVALKMLYPETLARRGGFERFRREAELAQRLTHPNTVRLYDFGTTEVGVPFIAWELLQGDSLGAAIRAAGRFDVARAAHVAAQILRSLAEAHALGIVHRDLKPDNVLLCEFAGERDYVKVLDFGLAKEQGGRDLTERGVIVGTPAYMAPEQVRGEAMTPATDLYALGLVVAEMLTGNVVFGSSVAMEIAMAQLSPYPVPLAPEVLASPLGPLLQRATNKDPNQRFRAATEMLAALESVLFSSGSTMMPRPPPTPVIVPLTPYPSQPGSASSIAYQPTYDARAPTPGPSAITLPQARPRSTGLVILIAVLSVLVLCAVAVTALFATGRVSLTPDGPPPRAAPASPPSEPVRAGVVARRFATLSNDEISRRIKAANFKIVEKPAVDPMMSMWSLESGGTVLVTRYQDVDTAMFAAQGQAMSGQVVALDGKAVMMVATLDVTSSGKLLDAITK